MSYICDVHNYYGIIGAGFDAESSDSHEDTYRHTGEHKGCFYRPSQGKRYPDEASWEGMATAADGDCSEQQADRVVRFTPALASDANNSMQQQRSLPQHTQVSDAVLMSRVMNDKYFDTENSMQR